jgi:hypothetical protein
MGSGEIMESCKQMVIKENPITGDPLNHKFICIKCGKQETEKMFNVPRNDVPEHVKNYGLNKVSYRYTSNKGMKAYF